MNDDKQLQRIKRLHRHQVQHHLNIIYISNNFIMFNTSRYHLCHQLHTDISGIKILLFLIITNDTISSSLTKRQLPFHHHHKHQLTNQQPLHSHKRSCSLLSSARWELLTYITALIITKESSHSSSITIIRQHKNVVGHG